MLGMMPRTQKCTSPGLLQTDICRTHYIGQIHPRAINLQAPSSAHKAQGEQERTDNHRPRVLPRLLAFWK